MSIHKAVTLGLSGNEMSKAITGSSESSVGRSAVVTGCGAALGAAASGAGHDYGYRWYHRAFEGRHAQPPQPYGYLGQPHVGDVCH